MRNVKEGMESLGEQVEKGRLITFGVQAFALFASPLIEFPGSVTPVAWLVFVAPVAVAFKDMSGAGRQRR